MDRYPIRDTSRQYILEGGKNRNSWNSIVIIDFAIYLLDTGGSFKTLTLSWSLANSTTSVWPRILSWWSLFSACGWKETIWFTNMSKPSLKPQEKHVYFNCTLEAEVSLLKVANAMCFCRRKHNQVSCIYSLHHFTHSNLQLSYLLVVPSLTALWRRKHQNIWADPLSHLCWVLWADAVRWGFCFSLFERQPRPSLPWFYILKKQLSPLVTLFVQIACASLKWAEGKRMSLL